MIALFAATTSPTLAASVSNRPGIHRRSGAGSPVKVLIVGDSLAFTLDLGLGEYQGSYGVDAVNAGILGCGVTNGAEYQLQGVDARHGPPMRR